jgi:hypothetical protein
MENPPVVHDVPLKFEFPNESTISKGMLWMYSAIPLQLPSWEFALPGLAMLKIVVQLTSSKLLQTPPSCRSSSFFICYPLILTIPTIPLLFHELL